MTNWLIKNNSNKYGTDKYKENPLHLGAEIELPAAPAPTEMQTLLGPGCGSEWCNK